MSEIELVVNGQAQRLTRGTTVALLLERLSLRRAGVAVAIAGRVVPRGEHSSRVLSNGDQVEVITAVGGG